jgi:hypothetical protein
MRTYTQCLQDLAITQKFRDPQPEHNGIFSQSHAIERADS